MTAADTPVRLWAPAKLNLYLHVTGRRGDGYHLLDSLVVFADLADTLELSPAPVLTLDVEGPLAGQAGPVGDNLVLRAARLLAQATGTQRGARMRLVKRIPAAAGLGGGSSDAAAALAGLMRLWDIAPDRVDLPALALRLGADVPVCLAGRPAFVGGIGETIDPAPDLPPAGLLLVNPGTRLPTPAVFAARRGDFSSSARFATPPADAAGLAALLAGRGNDLTGAACGLAPQIGDVLAALAGLPGCLLARMTGSGATCFGLFDDADAAAAAAKSSALAGRDWWIAATRIRSAEG